MSKRALLAAAIVAALGTWGYIRNAAADCIIPLSASAADSADIMYIVRGADGILRFTVQDANGNGTFGFTAATLGGNPFATGVTDTNGNGFADTLGSSNGFTNTPPYTTLPSGQPAANDPTCRSFCSGGSNPSATVGCVTSILVRGNDFNIYRSAFKECFTGCTWGAFSSGLGVFDSTTAFPSDGTAGGEDGFPGVHGTTLPFSQITQ